MQSVCRERVLLLSHVSVACVFRDVEDGLLLDSGVTVLAKSRTLSMIADCLDTNDTTMLSILHLLMSEVGGFDEATFDVHLEGLVRIIFQRGGLGELPDRVAASITL
jgi:hypothetical protein